MKTKSSYTEKICKCKYWCNGQVRCVGQVRCYRWSRL